MTPAPRSRRTFYTTYLLLLIVFTVVLLELGSAIVLTRTNQASDWKANSRHLYDPYRTHRLNPLYARDFDTGGAALHSIDGFRQREPVALDATPGTFRVLMFGGSTLYGIGAEPPYPRAPSLADNETISYRLQQALEATLFAMPDARRPADIDRIEVINAGVVGYATFQHLVYYNQSLHALDADLLLFLDGHNDFYNYRPYDQWGEYALGTPRLTGHVNARTAWFAGLGTVRWLARYSRLFRVIERVMERDWPYADESGVDPGANRFAQTLADAAQGTELPNETDSIATLSDTVIANYLQIRARAALDDSAMLVMLQPEIGFEAKALLSPADLALQRQTAELDENAGRPFNRALFPDLFAQYGIDFVDVAEIADDATDDDQLYVDYCHLTPAGAGVLASRMAPEVMQRIESIVAAR